MYEPQPGSFFAGGRPTLTLIARERWRLDEPVVYDTHDGLRVMIPAGYECDLASLPPLTEMVLGRDPAWDAPAVLHDHGYSHGFLPVIVGQHAVLKHTVSRRDTDRIFFDAMLANDTHPQASPRRARYLYIGVRLFGWWGWYKARRAER